MAQVADRTTQTGEARLLWMLYTDLNSRFNTLIEECAHLQDTIVGLAGPADTIDQLISKYATQDRISGFERSIVCHVPEASQAMLSARDRAFLSLWSALGGLLVGLGANQTQHLRSFTATMREVLSSSSVDKPTEAVFWYISLRGYYLNQVFRQYTAQIEHAHEKLVQMLENQPGSFPSPILLRRWNSGFYGEFLSDYSRHVNRESIFAVHTLLHPKDPPAIPGENQTQVAGESPPSWAPPVVHSVTHSWTHFPTSQVRYFDVNLIGTGTDKGSDPLERIRHRFALIRSAYFYLEQPVLFPLLYHECVHINFPSGDEAYGNGKFFGSRLDAIKSLRLAKFPTEFGWTYENFWDHFTEEVWTDAVALALGGRAYFVALTLQLFGLSGSNEFNHYQIAEDAVYPIDELGLERHRKYEEPSPLLEMGYLWEARLRIASQVLRRLSSKESDESSRQKTNSFLEAVDALISKWWSSGKAAFRAGATSRSHSDFWRFREEVNEWVSATVLSYIDNDATTHLARLSNCNELLHIDAKTVQEVIRKAVNGYREKYIPRPQPKNAQTDFTIQGTHRLEEVAADIRWTVAADVVSHLQLQPEQITDWSKAFASWMRNDGSAAYRVALEATRIRTSLVDALCDRLDGRQGPWSHDGGISDDLVAGKVAAVSAGRLASDIQLRRKLLRQRQMFWSSRFAPHYSESDDVRAWINEVLNRLMSRVGGLNAANPSPPELQVGTLTLGVIRPTEFRPSASGASPYLSAIARVQDYFQRASRLQERHANGDNEHLRAEAAFPLVFMPLVGEYQFLSYAHGSTPVERDAHPAGMTPRMLVKPRLVMLVGGEPLPAYQSRTGGLWGRIALIRFQYRWQWHDLLDRIQKMQASDPAWVEHYSLYLSSAWEDAILLSWHQSAHSLWSLDPVGIGVSGTNHTQVQSNYFVPSSPVPDPVTLPDEDRREWIDKFQDWTKNSNVVSSVLRRSGRFDYTVVWRSKDEPEPSSLNPETAPDRSQGDGDGARRLRSCIDGLSSMPEQLWRHVSNVATSFEQRVWSRDQYPGMDYAAVTHFAIRDSPSWSADREGL